MPWIEEFLRERYPDEWQRGFEDGRTAGFRMRASGELKTMAAPSLPATPPEVGSAESEQLSSVIRRYEDNFRVAMAASTTGLRAYQEEVGKRLGPEVREAYDEGHFHGVAAASEEVDAREPGRATASPHQLPAPPLP